MTRQRRRIAQVIFHGVNGVGKKNANFIKVVVDGFHIVVEFITDHKVLINRKQIKGGRYTDVYFFANRNVVEIHNKQLADRIRICNHFKYLNIFIDGDGHSLQFNDEKRNNQYDNRYEQRNNRRQEIVHAHKLKKPL